MTQQLHQSVWPFLSKKNQHSRSRMDFWEEEKMSWAPWLQREEFLSTWRCLRPRLPSWGTAEPCRTCKVRGRLRFTSTCMVSARTSQHLFRSFVSILRKVGASPPWLSKSPQEPINALAVLCSQSDTGHKWSAPGPFPHGLCFRQQILEILRLFKNSSPFLVVRHSSWDLSSPTWDWKYALGSENTVLTTGPPGNPLKNVKSRKVGIYTSVSFCEITVVEIKHDMPI